MDTKLIKQYGEDILCYRLRSARQKKRMQYEDFHKQLMRLHKEEDALHEQKRNLGWEPLVPPVQKGWKRCFVLRDDVARSKQADFFQGILNKINTTDWSYKKDFLVKRRKYGRKIYVVKTQNLLKPHEAHFSKLGFNEKEQQLFYTEFKLEKGRKEPVKRYVFIEPWRFVLRVKPNIIDKVRVRDEVIEARIKAIDNYLERNCLQWTQLRLLRGNCKWRHWYAGEKPGEADLFKNWPLERIIDSLEDQRQE